MMKAAKATGLPEKQFQHELAFAITAELPFYKVLSIFESLYKHIERKRMDSPQLTEVLNKVAHAANRREQ